MIFVAVRFPIAWYLYTYERGDVEKCWTKLVVYHGSSMVKMNEMFMESRNC